MSARQTEAVLEKTLTLAKFENKNDLKKWGLRSGRPMVCELSKVPAGEGCSFAKVIFPKDVTATDEQWPAITLSREYLLVADWRPYQYVTIEVYALDDCAPPVYFQLRDDNNAQCPPNKVWSTHLGTLHRGRQTVAIPIRAMSVTTDLARIRELHFMAQPSEATTIYIGEIRLHSINIAQQWNQFAAEMADLTRGHYVTANTELQENYERICSELNEIIHSSDHIFNNPPATVSTAEFASYYAPVARVADLMDKLRLQVPFLKAATQFRGKPLAYGWTSSLEKVFRRELPFKGVIGGTPLVELARNENEGSQLVLLPLRDLKKVIMETTALLDEQGHVLQRENIRIHPVGYVNTQKPSYDVDFAGWHPDPILSFLRECDLEALAWQPYWIDIHAPRDQSPGFYTGQITISADGMDPMVVPLQVRIWNFTLSNGSRLPLALGFFETAVAPVYIKDEAQTKIFADYLKGRVSQEVLHGTLAEKGLIMRQKCIDLLFSHRLTPDNIYRSQPPLIEDLKAWRKSGLSHFNVIYIPPVKDQQEGEPYPAEQKKLILDALAEYVPKLEQAGLLDMAYIYGFDEINNNHFAAAVDILGEIKKRYPKLPIMTTAHDQSFGMDSGLDAVVDRWVPITMVYDGLSASIQEARARGRQVWWYICCGPPHPYANWFVEYPATDHRLIMGFMAHKFQTDGFLYYALNLWRTFHNDSGNPAGNATPSIPYTETMNSGPLTTWSGQSWTTSNGDGQIMYPGPDGPLSTIRMENIRDGIEDYEYLQMLKAAVITVQQGRHAMESSWLTRAKAALEMNPALVTSLTSFTTDGNLLLSERKKIGCLLEEYFTRHGHY